MSEIKHVYDAETVAVMLFFAAGELAIGRPMKLADWNRQSEDTKDTWRDVVIDYQRRITNHL